MNSKEINQTKSLNFAQLLNNIPSAILLIDKEYNISFINYSAEVLLGESSKTILNNNLQKFLALDNQLFSLIDQVNKQKYNATQFDITINDFNKRNFIVDVEAGIYDIDHIILCFHKRAIAEQIDRSIVYKNIHSVSGLSSLMAHEIKNPLSGIKGAAQLLNDVVDGEDKDLSDNSIVKRTSVNIHDVLQRVNKIAKNSFAANCNIIELYDPSLPDIYGDINSLIQVFLNLVKNAAEAKPDGDITIQTGYRHGFNIKVSGSNNKLKLPIYVHVKDDGPGIPDTIKNHLFEPFVSSKHRGSGLGLSIVSSIIEEHGGIIEVNSSKNTIFTVLFPQYEDSK